MKKILIAMFLFVLLTAPRLIAAPNPPIVNASSAILMDAETGDVLYTKNVRTPMAPASTTKIMTAVLTLENLNLDKLVTICPHAASREGSSMHLFNKEQTTVRELLYGLMLVSGNDAATALAENLSGTEDKFAQLMTEKAHQIGMMDTVFKNASGLPMVGHLTTAYDMAILTRYALKVPGFAKIAGTKFKDFPGTKKSASRQLRNHNKLLWRYPYANGVKTGYTVKAGGCLVSSATHNGKTLITVVLKTPTIYDDTINLFNYGFN